MISDDAIVKLNSKQRKIFERIFQNPIPSDIKWQQVESLIKGLGGQTSERGKTSGSRVGFELNGVVATFHKPHSGSDMNKGAVSSLREFLIKAGIYEKYEI